MGYTYVYDIGNDDPLDRNELELPFGLFFDGTGNNFYNTRARKRTYGIDEFADQSKAENRPTWIDKALTKEYAEGKERNLKTLEKQGKDNSYVADFTNVARRYLCCEKHKYAIYIEGVGTQPAFDELEREITDVKKRGDETLPKSHGLGITGVRAKVLRGCEELAKRIDRIKESYGEKYKLTTLRIDVFGFSRGAAAARNFLYEINGKRRPEDDVAKREGVVGYEKNTFRNFGNDYREFIPIKGDVYYTTDGIKVEPEYLEKGKLPRLGYLGYCLLKEGVLSKEELKNLWVSIRFIGLYDTVASYLDGHMNIQGFSSGVESLQLNNIGKYRKAVHFTADDEHRMFFALTNLQPKEGGNYEEFSLPGVHSDIGGSYSTGKEEVILEVFDSLGEKLGISPKELLKPIPLRMFERYLKDRKEKRIIQSYIDKKFFTAEQLSLSGSFLTYKDIPTALKNILQQDWFSLFTDKHYWVLKGIREKVYKEYSYIPLYFMDEFFKNQLGDSEYNKHTTENINDKYSYGDNKTLKYAEKRLRKYVFDKGKKWKFLSQEEMKLQEKISKFKMEDKEKILPKREEVKRDNLVVKQESYRFMINDKPKTIFFIEQKQSNENDEVVERAMNNLRRSQDVLSNLRNKYLHWSADFSQIGMEPTLSRKRIYSKK